MSVEDLQKKAWVINRDNDLIFLAHSLMLPSISFSSYQPTAEEIIAGRKLSPDVPVPELGDNEPAPESFMGGSAIDPDRLAAIKAAVLAVAPENYGPAAFGRPAMPRVADIRIAAGYKDVTADEVIAAMPVAAGEGA